MDNNLLAWIGTEKLRWPACRRRIATGYCWVWRWVVEQKKWILHQLISKPSNLGNDLEIHQYVNIHSQFLIQIYYIFFCKQHLGVIYPTFENTPPDIGMSHRRISWGPGSQLTSMQPGSGNQWIFGPQIYRTEPMHLQLDSEYHIFFSDVSKIRHFWHWLSYQTRSAEKIIIFDVEVYAWGHMSHIFTLENSNNEAAWQEMDPSTASRAPCMVRGASVVGRDCGLLERGCTEVPVETHEKLIEFDINDWKIPPKLLEINTDTWWYAVAHLKSDVEIESPRFVFHLWEVFLVDTVSQRGF